MADLATNAAADMTNVHITEFTDPAEKGKKWKDKWLFTKRDEPIFCIAGIWRETKDVGESFTMLTTGPEPDISPYHDRQIVILERDAWAGSIRLCRRNR